MFKLNNFPNFHSNFAVFVLQMLKVATNETTTLHEIICTRLALDKYKNKEQQFNRHDVR